MGAISKYVDPILEWINLSRKRHTDSHLADLTNCLLTQPSVVPVIDLGDNQLTDETGVKLARYVATSSTIEYLDLRNNQLGTTTYLAMATALRVNSSLRFLYLIGNEAADWIRIDAAFVVTLRLNPVRHPQSRWELEISYDCSLNRLKDAAEKSTPPSMLEFLLCVHLDTEKIQTKIH
ncbi:MAG: hypothetical protein ACOVQN_08950 [Exiguobacterium sp.]